jgi:arylsulfatase A-like enzyme
VPFIVRWLEQLPKGKICDEPVISLDVTPTVCAAVGAKLPDDRVCDGRNMLPVLRGQSKEPLHETLFWYDGTDQWAVREGKWKLLSQKGSMELYDLKTDMSEKNDLSKENPQIVERLQQTFKAWKNQIAPQIVRQRTGRAKNTKKQ